MRVSACPVHAHPRSGPCSRGDSPWLLTVRSPRQAGGLGERPGALAALTGDAHLGHQLKREEEVVKVMPFCKLQRPPLLPLYILLSGEQARLQLLAEAVPGVKPASWGHKVTAGNPAQVWGRQGP